MDIDMKGDDGPTLKEYISQYKGHQKLTKLCAIIESALANKTPETVVQEAIELAYQIAQQTNAIGFFPKIQTYTHKYFNDKNQQVPNNLQGPSKNQIGQLQQEYSSRVKKKEQEINAQMKSLIKDSMRITLKELG